MNNIIKGSKHIVEIIDYSSEGDGVARFDDGGVVFVKDYTACGDICRIIITKILSNCCHAAIDEILIPSVQRTVVDCPVFYQCGGCDYRHIAYSNELLAKQNTVKNALKRIGGVDFEFDSQIEIEDVLLTGKTNGYRNKAQFPIAIKNGKTITGFYHPMSRNAIEVDECPAVAKSANEAVKCVRDWLNRYNIPVYDEKTASGLARHIYVRTGRNGLMVCLVINGSQIPHRNELIEALIEKCNDLSGLLLNINHERNSIVLGEKFITLWGQEYTDYELDGLSFRLSPESFFQINTDAALVLYNKVKEYAALSPNESLLDLYCGTGTITLFLARFAKNALGVENVPAAVENARKNAEKNNLNNTVFICSDAAEFDIGDFKPDCIITDPPRKGLCPEVIHKIIQISPQKLIYVSCNPATLARDIKLLSEYKIEKVCPVDMFPRTKHIETVVLMSRKDG